MDLDVLISSCSRPDILEISINTFKKYIRTTHNLRYVILEDKVDDEQRQELGRKWLEKNEYLFDEIHFSEKRMGPGFYYAPLVDLCKSEFFIHLDDDTKFVTHVNLDKMIDVMKRSSDMTEIIFRRGKTDPRNNPKNVKIYGLKLTQFDLYSNATGLFNTELTCRIIDEAGWKTQLREVQVLGRISKELNLKNYTLGFNNNNIHYEHLSAKRGYRKGGWKK